MRKILFITAHRKDRAPNQRFRFEQYLPFLEAHGFQCTFSPLIRTPEEDKQFYQGSLLQKVMLGSVFTWRRLKDVLRARKYDIVFIAREAFVTGTTVFERGLKKSGAKIIFDFDDSIWINVVSESNKALSWLKDANKTSKIISLSHKVFAGNKYLSDYANQYNDQVVIIPTTIDTDTYKPNYSIDKRKITIGWSGSTSTIQHFKYAIPALQQLKEKFGDQITIEVIGDANYNHEPLGIVGSAWNSKTELEDLHRFDIGIMPLPDDEWTKGKCGLKGLQYMALEIPTIMSPVGVNGEIIQDGVNGFLASSTEEWVSKLSLLIENPELRVNLGKEGRRTVEKQYSVISQQEAYLNQFNLLISDY